MHKPQGSLLNYKKIMDHLLKVQSCALIGTGRVGADFLHSLLDSHTEILTFSGTFSFHEFWRDSHCANSPNINLDDLLDEFLGKHIEKFKSRYDWKEGKDRLGKNKDESIDIDLLHYKKLTKSLLIDRTINSRNVLLAIYGAWALYLGQNIDKKKILFHQIHHAQHLNNYLNDFPNSKIISMTRDPRANFVSSVLHRGKPGQLPDNAINLYGALRRLMLDAYVLEKYNNDYTVIRIEDLGEKQILEQLCNWLRISYENQLTKSTWAGMSWRGDSLSPNKNEGGGWSAKVLENSWEKKLSLVDKYLFNFLMNSRLKFYGYQHRQNNILDYFLVPILILLPLSLELRYFSFLIFG